MKERANRKGEMLGFTSFSPSYANLFVSPAESVAHLLLCLTPTRKVILFAYPVCRQNPSPLRRNKRSALRRMAEHIRRITLR